jgi:hypothetical protein
MKDGMGSTKNVSNLNCEVKSIPYKMNFFSNVNNTTLGKQSMLKTSDFARSKQDFASKQVTGLNYQKSNYLRDVGNNKDSL